MRGTWSKNICAQGLVLRSGSLLGALTDRHQPHYRPIADGNYPAWPAPSATGFSVALLGPYEGFPQMLVGSLQPWSSIASMDTV